LCKLATKTYKWKKYILSIRFWSSKFVAKMVGPRFLQGESSEALKRLLLFILFWFYSLFLLRTALYREIENPIINEGMNGAFFMFIMEQRIEPNTSCILPKLLTTRPNLVALHEWCFFRPQTIDLAIIYSSTFLIMDLNPNHLII
jgi:hypothetical protein